MSPRNRIGFSLIELVTVVTILTALGAMSLKIMRTLEVTHRNAAEQAVSQRDIQRLANIVRKTSHAPVAVEIHDEGQQLILDDGQYRHHFRSEQPVGDQRVLSYWADPKTQEASPRHDQFMFHRDDDIRFRHDANQSILQVDIIRGGGNSPDLTIVALVDERGSS